MLKLIPLGGLGEIGLNMMVVEYDNVIFIIDAGIMFPEDHMLGVDIVIPAMDYLRENVDKIQAIILTHAHEDHIGALPYLLREIRLPVYGTAFTLEIVRNKLIEFDLNTHVDLNLVNPGEVLTIEPFDIEFIRVSHSTIDGVGMAITTPEGVVVHTGDFRISHSADIMKNTDISSFARFGEKGVMALLSDSTNVEVEGYAMSEQEVAKNLGELVEASPGRVIVALFASNVFRIQQIIDIARHNNRRVIFNGRSMEQITDVAMRLGYLECPTGLVVDIKQIHKFEDHEVVIITTGSQGEPMSALTRMASGVHKHINVRKGDTVLLSSKHIPGNEKAIASIINKLYRRGAEVVYSKIARIHASGHAHQEELKMMINLTKPEYFIPIHGEYRHLVVHARLAEKLGMPRSNVIVAENGQVIAFDGENGGRIEERVQTGRILVDGKGIGDVGRSVLKERRELSEGGLVVVTMIIDEETGVVLYGPELISKGFVFDSATGYLVDDAQCVILEIVEEIEAGIDSRVELIRKKLQRALKQYFAFAINRRPLIVPIIIEV
ncbi:ribonuclease J [Desulfobacter hydrogenophilus]|uniref:Ribonuclease J n=1 Tax=Desulfobacter hydrogenophilus TaxID=2291 RepID=A0A328F834_9BACT|nr:ribonuclease J [Desulfobacter hydrogenophilus]NDY73253.1 ribonuclease J [Desulfobacter hydrogenophilus]QBH13829.1 ribonuclease J [Desulfobacter hydrogenophilus]RAM00844.1 ribonuclease J [Desulfobacter hydrogenophilus]